MKFIKIGQRIIGGQNPVFVIAEAGINHNGSFTIAKKMIDTAKKAGVDCIKFQTHIAEEEMIKTNIKPANISKKTLWSIIKNCELTEMEEKKIQKFLLWLSKIFSSICHDQFSCINSGIIVCIKRSHPQNYES